MGKTKDKVIEIKRAPTDPIDILKEPETEDDKNDPTWLRLIKRIHRSKAMRVFVTAAIFVNFFSSAAEATSYVKSNEIAQKNLYSLGLFLQGIFSIELLLNIRANWWKDFWNDGWNRFDLVVVGAIWPIMFAGNRSTIAIARLLRSFRLVGSVDSLNQLLSAIIFAIPKEAGLLVMLIMINWTYAILGTEFYRESNPDYFGNISTTSFTLYQVMTLAGWAAVYLDVQNNNRFAWLYFVSYILITTYIFTSVFAALYCEAMDKLGSSTEGLPSTKRVLAESERRFHRLIRALRKKVEQVKRMETRVHRLEMAQRGEAIDPNQASAPRPRWTRVKEKQMRPFYLPPEQQGS